MSHRIGNRIITWVFNTLMGTKLSDVLTGMYMLKTEDASNLHFHTSGFNVEVEIASQLAQDGSVTEVPLRYRERIGKQKLSTWKDGLAITSTIFRLARDYNPAFPEGQEVKKERISNEEKLPQRMCAEVKGSSEKITRLSHYEPTICVGSFTQVSKS
jgi:hypothetical protein